MYIEARRPDGRIRLGRIARVRFSKTGRTIYYDGKAFLRVGRGEYFESESGESWWFSGPRSATGSPPPTSWSRSAGQRSRCDRACRRDGMGHETAKAPRERGLRRSSQGRRGERGHQGCAETRAALGSEGSSRTTGVLNACEREEGVRGVVLAWRFIVSFRSVTFDTGNSRTRRGRICGGWLASASAACARREGVTRTITVRPRERSRASPRSSTSYRPNTALHVGGKWRARAHAPSGPTPGRSGRAGAARCAAAGPATVAEGSARHGVRGCGMPPRRPHPERQEGTGRRLAHDGRVSRCMGCSGSRQWPRRCRFQANGALA
jgi:hypothetical protein